MSTIFEKSKPGRRGVDLPTRDIPQEFYEATELGAEYSRSKPAELPEVSELDVVRHFTNLSTKNFSVDKGMYPLGSCTMKYNPKFTEDLARLPGMAGLHPLLPQLRRGGLLAQGALGVLYETEVLLKEVTGMDAFTMQPMAGAHGELTGIMLIAAYHRDKGNKKSIILVPDSAHGTNPASAALAGFEVVTVPSSDEGVMKPDTFKEYLTDDVAGVMMTNPNTVGLFNPYIKEIADLAHAKDALLYYDGANLNAIMGYAKPADLGFDIVHLNLHKTMGTPHGGGGPGSGPVGVVEKLEEFLPVSRIKQRQDGTLFLDYDQPKSIGYIAPFYGNFGVTLKAYAYMLALGGEGLKKASEHAVLNTNYLRVKLAENWDIPFNKICKHEVVLSSSDKVEEYGVSTLDVAKGLIDAGFHPPTVYFPLVIKEALMIEPTETEPLENLDAFVEAMTKIAEAAKNDPESLHNAPVTTPVGRLDEVGAARKPNVVLPE
ncbi:aminomethyl-transferring glycine dehydrogenase subunit GcvPB [Dethiosulfatarculus sandiegensis]|uniref:glycine dehydrogenase (aminomethyl-transferring) n=1 Tax=Dethiosulfatarculus sandiegensis TaxID=1429043 RepID=A0A0D2IXI2_9BACT|nr:aminomethyl-transferring glycine dehydrogenase subunit GcvPB [Dethiosulfatarculus sandiegensis]KIX10759.1 glycine dehydrogenase subunit 2 [Dethiosulfatarculus sandiegensis]